MCRILAFLTITIFVFNLLIPSFAQELSVQEQANREAKKDLDTVRKTGLFMSSFLCGSLGSIVGGFAGYQIGNSINDVPPGGFFEFFNDEQSIGCCVGAILLGGVVAPLFLNLNHNPNPPSGRLIGKSPAYVEAYTQAYQKKSKQYVTAGSMVVSLPLIGMGLCLLGDLQY